MLRARQVCCAVVVVATVSQAVRSNVEASQESAVHHVMDSLGALLQTRGLRMIAGVDVTPGAGDSMTETLTRVISEIEQNVVTKIKEGHAETQAVTDQKINELTAETAQAVLMKKVADDADDKWFTCVKKEKAMRVAIEDAAKTLSQSRISMKELCGMQDEQKHFNREPDVELKLECNFSRSGNCGNMVENYRLQINSMLKGLKSDVGAATDRYTEAKNACDKAKADVVKKHSAHNDSVAAWESQREQCLTKHETRLVSMCQFGSHLQRKCEKAAAYNLHETDIDQVEGQHSQPDRVQEWKTAVMSKCILSKVVAGAELDGVAVVECEKSVNFAEQVGVLNRRHEEFENLTKADKFTCTEPTIEFGGRTWRLPDGQAPDSGGYATEPFKPEVSLVEDTAPFSFCGGEESGNAYHKKFYVGCYVDDGKRMFKVGNNNYGHTGETCAKECAALEHNYFALQNGGDCKCGDRNQMDIGSYVRRPDAECGDEVVKFGGYRGGRAWRNAVYHTNTFKDAAERDKFEEEEKARV